MTFREVIGLDRLYFSLVTENQEIWIRIKKSAQARQLG